MGKKQKNTSYTIMIVPHSESPTYSLQFPLKWLRWLGISAVLLASISLMLTYNYQHMRAETRDHYVLLNQHRLQQEQILFLAKQTRDLEDEVQSLRELDRTIRDMMRLAPAASTASLSAGDEFLMLADLDAQSREVVASRGSLSATILQTESSLQRLRDDITDSQSSFKTLETAIVAQQARQAATPSIWPTSGRITSGYGYRSDPFGGSRQFHTGIDIGAPRGTPIYATANGVVQFSGYQGGYGYVVYINHGYGFTTVYAHMHRIVARSGQRVTKGQLIGYAGSTGRSTGPHLHYEVRLNGRTVNPLNYLGR